jgi:hypothetical protein
MNKEIEKIAKDFVNFHRPSYKFGFKEGIQKERKKIDKITEEKIRRIFDKNTRMDWTGTELIVNWDVMVQDLLKLFKGGKRK